MWWNPGGGLATLLVLDIIINFPHVPVSKLHLWTFGAPQVADKRFFLSAIQVVPRLRSFVQQKHGRFHRFVTMSDKCEADLVSTLVEKALPFHRRNLRGRAARRLGGARHAAVHFADPHFLLTPHQFDNGANSSIETTETRLINTTTRSAIAAHSIVNYVDAISRESKDHPLSTDLPFEIRAWLREEKVPKEMATNETDI